MTVQDVHIIDIEALEAGMGRFHDMLAGQSPVVRTVTHGEIYFCRENERFSWILRQRFADHNFRSAPGIGVGRIEEVDAQIVGGVYRFDGGLPLCGVPVGKPTAEADFTYPDTGSAHSPVLHGCLLSNLFSVLLFADFM